MEAATDPIGVKRLQRQALLVGLIVAAIPILCRFLMLCAFAVAPDAFPTAGRTLMDVRFRPIRIVLLCVAVAGSTIVNCVRVLLDGGRTARTALGYFLFLLLCFFAVPMMFSVTLLASHIGWPWLVAMSAAGGANLWVACIPEMEIAGSA